jgi:WD40 repeat protein
MAAVAVEQAPSSFSLLKRGICAFSNLGDQAYVLRTAFGNGIIGTAISNGSVRLFDPETLSELHDMKGHTQRIYDISFVPEKQCFFS